jgi:hypothetical protein
MCLGQRGEARDVGEYESGACRLYGVRRHEICDRPSTLRFTADTLRRYTSAVFATCVTVRRR